MKYAAVLTPIIPVRSQPSEQSEMVTQLLFGDLLHVVEQKGDWASIINSMDEYKGWVDQKMLTFIPEEEFVNLSAQQSFLIRQPSVDVRERSSSYPFRISIGASLPGYDPQTQRMKIANRNFSIPLRAVYQVEEPIIKDLLRTASYFIHTPYLWGGKSIAGIDCSGFVQIVYRLHNILLPRDASQQIALGEAIPFEKHRPGDLAFFRNDNGRVVHVGIVFAPQKILHASASVHVDGLTKEGIWSEERQKYTHHHVEIRRLITLKRERKEK